MYPEPRLAKGKTSQIPANKKGAEKERKRRKGTRKFNEELSRYYVLTGDPVWE